ncbi:MAG TPA: NAD-dependent epimerase/dehydratase family protein [Thermodesulfobacteriota bacterium]|nr:NAD-dependent epimerase/dehydratase family protein [Thermodesulfobacteriota bacterium]
MATLVTGATGFLGSHVARKLAQRGEKLRILLRKTSKTLNIDDIPAERVYGDILDADSVKRALEGCDAIYHTAGFVSFRKADYKKMEDINVKGTVNALSAALEAGVKRAVYTSSVAAVGVDPGGGGADEKTPFTLEGEGIAYLNTKYRAEREALKICEKGLPLVVVNPSVVIGPGDVYLSSTGAILWYCKRKFPGYMDGTLNMVDVEDVAEGHILAAEKGRVGERYILANKNMTIKEFFNLMERTTGIPSPKMKIPYFAAFASAFLVEKVLGLSFPNFSTMDLDSVKLSKFNWFIDSSKAVKELGFRQTPIEESIRKTVKWFKDNGLLDS